MTDIDTSAEACERLAACLHSSIIAALIRQLVRERDEAHERFVFWRNEADQRTAERDEAREATQAQVRVRDLVWEGNVSSLEIPCSYWFDGDDEDGWEVKTTWRTGTDDLDDGLKYYALDEAKAAAQADYAARIMAALIPDTEGGA